MLTERHQRCNANIGDSIARLPVSLCFFPTDARTIMSWESSVQLSEEERSLVNRFRFERDRRRYVISHKAVRQVLGDYLAVSPQRLIFVREPLGKPKLQRIPGTPDTFFSLSHSGEYGAVAVTRESQVGVDLEKIRSEALDDLTQTEVFTRAELQWLGRQSVSDRVKNVFRLWVAKEALVKALGVGLSMPLNEVEPLPLREGSCFLQFNQWFVTEVDVLPGYACAVTTKRGIPVTKVCFLSDQGYGPALDAINLK